MSERPPLRWPQRVAVWDAALGAVRAVLRGAGLCEVVTPVRLAEVAIEPFIEPIAAAGSLLATSPELPMKRMLCRGAPSIFQIAPCFRAAEHGALHREEFHMVEWYRVEHDAAAVRRDVEAVAGAVFEAVAAVLDEPELPAGPAPGWAEVAALPLMERTLGVGLRGDEDAAALAAAIAPVSAALGDPLAAVRHARLASFPRAHTLAAWTAVFSAWCDVRLDPWLAERAHAGLHLVELPAALAALSETGPGLDGRTIAHRFESYVGGRELANGYRELRDPEQQRRRFEDVNALRRSLDQPPLPMPDGLLHALHTEGLPRCAGVAVGLDRLVLLATGRARLGDVVLEIGAPDR